MIFAPCSFFAVFWINDAETVWKYMEKCVIIQRNGEKTNRRQHYVQIWNAFHGIEGQQVTDTGRGRRRSGIETGNSKQLGNGIYTAG